MFGNKRRNILAQPLFRLWGILAIERADLRWREHGSVEFHVVHVDQADTREAGDGRHEHFAEALIDLRRERLHGEDSARSHIGRIGRTVRKRMWRSSRPQRLHQIRGAAVDRYFILALPYGCRRLYGSHIPTEGLARLLHIPDSYPGRRLETDRNSLWTRPLAYGLVLTCFKRMSRGISPKRGMPGPDLQHRHTSDDEAVNEPCPKKPLNRQAAIHVGVLDSAAAVAATQS